MQPLKIKLLPKQDTDKQTFYIGKLKFPGTITLGNGASFCVYISDEIKELHIATPSDSDKYKTHSNVKKKSSSARHSNIAIDLTKQKESITTIDSMSVYRGTLSITASVKADDGLVFLVFVADPGQEELQISMPEENRYHKNKSEIIRKRRDIIRND